MADQEEQTRRGLAPREVVCLADENGVLEMASARLLIRILDLEAQGRRRVDLAVTGGGDGIDMLRRVAVNPLAGSVDWSRVHFWWGDERFVPADDPDRNALQARQALLDGLVAKHGLPEANIHEMPADTRTLEERDAASEEQDERLTDEAARDYQQEIRTQMGADPHFDIAWFGVGPDAHFASLMPGLPGIRLNDPDQLVCGVTHSPKLPPLRVSLTVPMIQSSREVWVIASGERKHDAMTRVLGQPVQVDTPQGRKTQYLHALYDDASAPVSFAAGRERTLWFIDRTAAPAAPQTHSED